MTTATLIQRYYLPGLKRLIELCAKLQEEAGDGTFFLTQRSIRDFLGKREELGDKRSLTQATRFLFRLEHDGVLQRVSTGTGRKANEYRYLGGRNGD